MNISKFFARCTRIARLLAIMALGPGMSLGSNAALGAEEYRLGPNDVIRLEIHGEPDNNRDIIVAADGSVAIPLIGDILIEGMTLKEAEESISRRYQEKRVLRDADVTLSVARYRPFYIDGTIAKPGSYEYVPGLTVRQAIALAGGYDLQRFKIENPLFIEANLRSEYVTLLNRYSMAQVRLARLRAELHEGEELKFEGTMLAGLSGSLFEDLLDLEKDKLAIRNQKRRAAVAAIRREIELADSEIEAYERRQDDQQKEAEFHAIEVNNVRTLNKKGLVPLPKLIEMERLASNLSSELMKSMAETARAQQRRETLLRNLTDLENQLRIDVLEQIQEAQLELEGIQAEIHATGEKMIYTSLVKSEAAMARETEPVIVIHRGTGEQAQEVKATENTRLKPGDVVEVVLKPAWIVTFPTN